jgi:hypothetical protein
MAQQMVDGRTSRKSYTLVAGIREFMCFISGNEQPHLDDPSVALRGSREPELRQEPVLVSSNPLALVILAKHSVTIPCDKIVDRVTQENRDAKEQLCQCVKAFESLRDFESGR